MAMSTPTLWWSLQFLLKRSSSLLLHLVVAFGQPQPQVGDLPSFPPALTRVGVHDSSSRSHALLKIYILNNESQAEGVLTLVDLAGSEHKIDSMYHSAERRKEGAAINSSLMALKECVRAKAAGKDLSHFYRKSKLTMALKASFADPSARTTVIVTVSPASKDTEHSLNSLRHACIMDGQDAPTQNNNEGRFVTGGDLSIEWLGEINVTAIAKKNRGRGVEDLKTSNGNTFGGEAKTEDKPLSDKEKLQMRRGAERVAWKSLAASTRSNLKSSREQLGAVARQQIRLSRTAVCAQTLIEETEYNLQPVQTEDFHWQFVGHQKANPQPQPVEPAGAPEKPARRPVHKLRMSIYGSDDGVPEGIKRRQFGALLKQNGYSRSEVDAILQREVEAEQELTVAHPSSRESSLRSQSSQSAPASNRVQTMSAGLIRPLVQQQSLPISTPTVAPAPTMSRHEAAKLRRLQLEADSVSKKVNTVKKTPVTPTAVVQNPVGAIQQLEAELQDPNLTSAARHGLMKRIATMRSVMVREERQKEQERREAANQMKQMKIAAAAEEAKKRLGIPSPIQPPMRNTSQVETVWSPRPSPKPSPRPIIQATSVATSTNLLPVGPFGAEGDLGGASNYERSDSLDRYMKQSTEPVEAMPNRSEIDRGRSRGRGRYSHGASSAPFANDMNWDK
jgi:hypothetical protein